MGNLVWTIAIRMILLFGFWAGYRRRQLEKRKTKKAAKIYPLAKGKRQTKLYRVK